MHPIARPASRLVPYRARIVLHPKASLARWPVAAFRSPCSTPAPARLYSSLPPFPPPPPPPSSSASKEEVSRASPTPEASSSPNTEPSSFSTSTSPGSNSSSSSSSSTSSQGPPDSNTNTSSTISTDSPQKPHDPLPEVASKIYTALPPALSENLSHLMDTLQTRLLTASSTLNALTGYAPIEAIKHQNTLLETRLASAQDLVRTARHTYKTTNAKRAATQREVTTLLARKETWTPSDLERFTQLYRQDHSLEQECAAASEALTDAEHAEQALGQQLNAGILKRYHEEQIWSDRIRRASTWGTWGLMGVNVLLFLVLQFVAEPWKRRRLVRGVVEEEKAVLEGVAAELAGLRAALATRDEPTEVAATTAAAAEAEAAGADIDAAPVEAASAAAAAAAEEELNDEPITPEEALAAKVEDPAVQNELDREVASALEVLEQVVPAEKTWREFLSDPALIKARLADLYSERRIDLRMRDASILALEGAAAGATLAGGLAILLLRKT
ncbi:Sensitive to high expression protein 9-like protein [Colletotrichum orbiculare MAFF 240422]|uniref:Sensitive to high expression protein 9, mitochondrial n=1 Tax=Colletotrichum orbiculare (strain 104-T / ATCC 96160 / CBS 514.97 / LARS 414 / MAFF 240422) TaxID=1213857 RepID=N4V650_COLOR|nr:Sensitive to high expression protein 9-like protein [Colletotrichum orbiculare MAFF 240422]